LAAQIRRELDQTRWVCCQRLVEVWVEISFLCFEVPVHSLFSNDEYYLATAMIGCVAWWPSPAAACGIAKEYKTQWLEALRKILFSERRGLKPLEAAVCQMIQEWISLLSSPAVLLGFCTTHTEPCTHAHHSQHITISQVKANQYLIPSFSLPFFPLPTLSNALGSRRCHRFLSHPPINNNTIPH
jgi:hypothetical protein